MALIDFKRDAGLLPYKRRRLICQEWCDCGAIAINLGCRKGDPDVTVLPDMFDHLLVVPKTIARRGPSLP